MWGLLEVLYVTVPSRDGGYLGQVRPPNASTAGPLRTRGERRQGREMHLFVTWRPRRACAAPQDLTAWYAEHGPTLDDMCGLGPNLPEQLTQLLATARPDTSPQYW